MRVIAGSAKGHNLKSPEGLLTRPTLDKVKGSLFSMLTGKIYGATALDLFAGSGALGIEALSRGAEKCTFVDTNRDAISCVLANLEHTKLRSKAIVEKCDSLSFLENCLCRFDIIFLDPPYHKGLTEKAMEIIHKRNLLQSGGLVCVETDEDELSDIAFDGFFIVKNKQYGRISLKIYKNSID